MARAPQECSLCKPDCPGSGPCSGLEQVDCTHRAARRACRELQPSFHIRGIRWSGIGRELGEEGLDAFREPKHVHLHYVMERKSYWYPYRDRPIPAHGSPPAHGA